MEHPNKHLFRNTIKLGLVLGIGYLLWREFSNVDFNAMFDLLSSIGMLAPVILLPIIAMTFLDAQGWNACFVNVTSRFTAAEAFLVRTGTDALNNSLPAGVALAETIRPILANQMHGIPYPAGIAAGVVSKINTAVSQIIFLISGLAFLALTLRSSSAGLPVFHSTFHYILIGIIGVIVIVLLWLPYKGTTFRGAYSVLNRLVPVQRFRIWLNRHEETFIRLDDYICVFATEHKGRLYISLLLFLAGWFITGFETYLIVTLLGYSISLPEAIAMEAAVSFIRVLFFFLPAGIGAQEAGFVTLFTALGIADPLTVSAAFVIVRRSKEIVWILIGYSMFGMLKFNPFKQSATQTS